MLDQASDPGMAKIAEWKGPLCLEFAAKLPGTAVSNKAYLRPAGPRPPPDAFRLALWKAQQAGEGCDAELTAANGESRRGHRLVLAAACPALAERMGDGGAGVRASLGRRIRMPMASWLPAVACFGSPLPTLALMH